MTILITGGAGFIGANLCLTLLKKKQRVIAVDNYITGNRKNLKVLNSFKQFTFIESDITCPSFKKILESIANIDEIYHLACPTGVPNLKRLAEEMLMTSLLGTKHVLELALKNRAKLLITSSSEVYGDPQLFPQDENYNGHVNPVGIRSPYEEGKRFAESLALTYFKKYKVDVRLVRLFNCYGPFMSFGDTRVIPKFFREALSGEPITVYGNGRQTRTFCYIDDAIDSFFKVLIEGKPGNIYNVGSDQEIQIIDLAKKIAALTKSKSKIAYLQPLAYDHNRRKPDLAKIHQLGWKQITTLSAGLAKTLQWFGY